MTTQQLFQLVDNIAYRGRIITDVKFPAAPGSKNVRVQYTDEQDDHDIEYMAIIDENGNEVDAPAYKRLG